MRFLYSASLASQLRFSDSRRALLSTNLAFSACNALTLFSRYSIFKNFFNRDRLAASVFYRLFVRKREGSVVFPELTLLRLKVSSSKVPSSAGSGSGNRLIPRGFGKGFRLIMVSAPYC